MKYPNLPSIAALTVLAATAFVLPSSAGEAIVTCGAMRNTSAVVAWDTSGTVRWSNVNARDLAYAAQSGGCQVHTPQPQPYTQIVAPNYRVNVNSEPLSESIETVEVNTSESSVVVNVNPTYPRALW